MEKHINNYEAAEVLDRFMENYIKPLQERIGNAEKTFNNPSHRWDKGEYKNAENAYNALKERCIYYKALHHKLYDLCKQHERLTSKLLTIYNNWREHVSVDGVQPNELMGSQAKMLQQMFCDMYEILKDDFSEHIKQPNNGQ